ncbi:glutathione peroxidase [bacterium]|nr:glutathione peroxidase [bacterium]
MTRPILTIAAITLTAALALAGNPEKSSSGANKPEKATMETTKGFTSIPFETIDGKATSLDAYKGKVILIVNTASKCGYTPQYEGLEALYQEYKDSGLVVIGFPANNFGGQEPGTNEQILEFCQTKFDVTFPMMAKISVKGKDIHPLYKYLTEDSKMPGEISWNFNKFLIDRDGRLAARYESKVKPQSEELVGQIKTLLNGKG